MQQPGPIRSFPLRTFPSNAFPGFTGTTTETWSAPATPTTPVWSGTITSIPGVITVAIEIQVQVAGAGEDGIAARFPMG